jgi:hypothetical protein
VPKMAHVGKLRHSLGSCEGRFQHGVWFECLCAPRGDLRFRSSGFPHSGVQLFIPSAVSAYSGSNSIVIAVPVLHRDGKSIARSGTTPGSAIIAADCITQDAYTMAGIKTAVGNGCVSAQAEGRSLEVLRLRVHLARQTVPAINRQHKHDGSEGVREEPQARVGEF